MRTTTRQATATAGIAVVLALCPAVGGGAPPTPVTELVLYGIDADTHE